MAAVIACACGLLECRQEETCWCTSTRCRQGLNYDASAYCFAETRSDVAINSQPGGEQLTFSKPSRQSKVVQRSLQPTQGAGRDRECQPDLKQHSLHLGE